MGALAYEAVREREAASSPAGTAAVDLTDVVQIREDDGRTRVVLHGITLRVEEGGFAALEGGVGAGKTTLLGLIAGLERPTRGHVSVLGVDLARLSEDGRSHWRRGTVGLVRPGFDLLPFLDLASNVELPLLALSFSRRERRERTLAALGAVRLAHQAGRRPVELSADEGQRAAVARAIVIGPRLLLADEPTRGLDAAGAAMVLGLLEDLRRELGTTVVIATGDPTVAARARARYRLQDGAVTLAGLRSR